MICVENLTKQYGDVAAVDDVSFEVREGETFALLGPNGSGKSTTLKSIAGLCIPTKGKIVVGGQDVFRNSKSARGIISYLPQRISFHKCLTAEEVLRFYCRLRKLPDTRIEEVLHRSHFNFNGFCEKRVSELSGGMVQRLGLAVACLPDAKVLLLDEPTVSLDPEGAIEFRKFLKSLKAQGKTILFSSHVLADVEQLADRVAIFVKGKIVTLKTTADLRDELGRGGLMRIAIRNIQPQFAQIAERVGAREVVIEGDELIVSAKPEDRHAILDALRNGGAKIASLSTEESALEDVYIRYAGNEKIESV